MNLHQQARKQLTEDATRYGHKMTRWVSAPSGRNHYSRCKNCGIKISQDGWGEIHHATRLFREPCISSDTADTAFVERTSNPVQRAGMAQGVHPIYR